jgi:hypothetical protein
VQISHRGDLVILAELSNDVSIDTKGHVWRAIWLETSQPEAGASAKSNDDFIVGLYFYRFAIALNTQVNSAAIAEAGI